MVAQLPTNQIEYPDSDGKLISDNTKQFRWITVFKYNQDRRLAANLRALGNLSSG